ncbi:hypothetical protein ACFL47_10435, partial [Candidatus Latescibacterota bacterium]
FIGLIAGYYCAFIFNLRSIYIFSVIASFLFFLIYAIVDRVNKYGLRYHVIVMMSLLSVVSFILGFSTFQKQFISPITSKAKEYGIHQVRAHHPVSHVLVLGLAVPENNLSRREGIKWSDDVGMKIAKEMDSESEYLGRNYEKALFLYFAKLWIYYPKEMLGIYIDKTLVAGYTITKGMFKEAKNHSIITRICIYTVFAPLLILPNGFFYILFYAFLVILPLLLTKKIKFEFLFAISSLSVTGLLFLLESIISIPSYFVFTLHCYLLFLIFFSNLLFYQLIVNLLFATLNHFRSKQGKPELGQ